MARIAYQGAPGSYSHSVGVKHFGEENEFIGVHKFEEIFAAIKKVDANYGIVPIENTLAGSVYENYDHLYNYDTHVIAEYKLKINHNLLSLKNAEFKDIKKVFSHPKALEQCDDFFENNPNIEEIVNFDTAGAAKYVSESEDKSMAAIASEEAAKIYRLKILNKDIQDNKNNWTRFFIVAPTEEHSPKANKSSLILSTAHTPGSLFRAIKVFAHLKLNLTKIESRPLPGHPFEYFFYIDFEFNNDHFEDVKVLLQELKKETKFLKILGYYQKSG